MKGLRARTALTLFGLLAVAACGNASSTSSGSPTAAPTATGHSSAGAISAIASTGSTCTQFDAGTLSVLNEVRYSNSGAKVAHVTPTAFDYWVKFVPTAAPPNTLTIAETTHGGAPLVSTGGTVFHTAAAGTCVPLSNSVSYSSGLTKVRFTGVKGTTYLVQIHYTAAAFIGETLSPGASVAISTTEVSGSNSSVSVTSG